MVKHSSTTARAKMIMNKMLGCRISVSMYCMYTTYSTSLISGERRLWVDLRNLPADAPGTVPGVLTLGIALSRPAKHFGLRLATCLVNSWWGKRR